MNVKPQQVPQPQASLYSQLQYQNQSGPQSVASNGYSWNGTQWVISPQNFESAGVTYSNYTFQQPTQALPPGCNYEQYKASYEQAARLKNEAAKPGLNEFEKAELLRQAQWAEYYSSLAYYGRTSSQPQPQVASQVSAPIAPAVVQSSPPEDSTKKSVNSDEFPESLQRYVNRITSGYRTETERKRAQEMVERVIENAVRNNTLWTTDWDKCTVSSQTNDGTSMLKNVAGAVEESKSYDSLQPKKHQKAKSDAIRHAEPISSGGLPDSTLSTVSPVDVSSSDGVVAKCKAKISGSRSYYGPVSPQPSVHGKKDAANILLSPVVDMSASKKRKFQAVTTDSLKKSTIASGSHTAPTDPQMTNTCFDVSLSKLDARANRFSDMNIQVDVKNAMPKPKPKSNSIFAQYMGQDVIGGGKKLDDNDFERMTVKGTCQVLEKEYLRLTAPPQANKVRPLEVLQRHLTTLQTMWVRKEREYSWFCSQLKAIRQDLTVQRLNNDFSVQVYETHARIALEVADLNEFNQSQTQLKELYKVISEQKDEKVKNRGLKNVNEFIAYRLIYYVFLTLNKKYEGGSTDVMNILLSLTPGQIKDPCISYALKVREAVSTNNYHLFFRLHGSSAPRMSAYLLDFMVSPLRFSTLKILCKAYHPSLDVKFVLAELGFIVDDHREWDEGVKWLKSCGCLLNDDKSIWNVKDSTITESALEIKRSLI